MTDDQKKMLELSAGDSRAIRIGDTVLYPPLMVGSKAFQFDAWQNGFLFHLQQNQGDMESAANKIGKSLEWAQKFVTTRKFREFRNAKLTHSAVSNGALFEEWRETGIAGMRGYRAWWEATCVLCHEENKYHEFEMEAFRQDDMTLKPTCKCCFQAVVVEYKREDYKPTREQVQFWSELGNRVSPKIERIQHEFSSETFSFKSEDAQ